LVGPDNGLLSLAFDQLGGPVEAVELACSMYTLPEVCKTFEGRDLYSPVAAHIAQGVALSRLGAPVKVDSLKRLELPEPVIEDGTVTATVVYIDRFGNVQLNLKRCQLEKAGISVGSIVNVIHGEESWKVPFVETFADVEPKEILIYEDSYRHISFSVNQADAASIFQIVVGDQLRFEALS
jgi:S-adenosylmethionine hydrolase